MIMGYDYRPKDTESSLWKAWPGGKAVQSGKKKQKLVDFSYLALNNFLYSNGTEK